MSATEHLNTKGAEQPPDGMDVLGYRVDKLEQAEEERKRSFLYVLREWAGVIVLIIAVIYTFPFDVVDRFVSGPEKEKAVELSAVRTALEELADTAIAAVRAQNNVADPQAVGMLQSLFYSKAIGLLEKNYAVLQRRRNDLALEELMAISIQYVYLGRAERAFSFLEAAKAKMQDVSASRQAELLQIEANAWLMAGAAEGRNRCKVLLEKALSLAENGQTPMEQGLYVKLLSNLGGVEMFDNESDGCARVESAIKYYLQHQLFRVDNGAMHRILCQQIQGKSAYCRVPPQAGALSSTGLR